MVADEIIGGQAVEVDAQAGRIPGSQPLGQKAADEAGEHVPGAAAGQGRIARGVEADAAVRVRPPPSGPLSVPGWPRSLAAVSRARSRRRACTSGVVSPTSRAISPGWGVRIRGPATPLRQAASAARLLMPSASMTMGRAGPAPAGAPVPGSPGGSPVPGPRARVNLPSAAKATDGRPGRPTQGPGPPPPRAGAGSWPR